MKSIVFIFGSGRAGMALALACTLMFPLHDLAAQPSGLVVTPLEDDSGPERQPARPGMVMDEPGQVITSGTVGGTSEGHAGGAAAGEVGLAPGTDGAALHELLDQPSYKDGIVMAYLVELMRKQDKPCPSGTKPPVPPSLLFSEPLCRVAESVGRGIDFPEVYAEQGIYASRWRMFSAGNMPAQQVATRLRAEHCEALHEPYTHIGAWHGPEGWRIVLAALTKKPETEHNIVPAETASGAAPDAGSDPRGASVPAGASAPSQAVSSSPPPEPVASPVPAKEGFPIPPPVSAPASVPAAPSPVAAPVPAMDIVGQEARALFQVLNEIRAKGGSCIGQPARTAPPLVFNGQLQTSAERAAVEAAAKGGFEDMSTQDAKANIGARDYPASKIAKLIAVSRSPASVVADIWMINPSRCGMLLSPDFEDIGVAFSDGYWVVLLGEKAKGVPSRERPVSPQDGANW